MEREVSLQRPNNIPSLKRIDDAIVQHNIEDVRSLASFLRSARLGDTDIVVTLKLVVIFYNKI